MDDITKVIPILERAKLSISDVASITSGAKRVEVYLTKGRGKAIITETSKSYTLKMLRLPATYIIFKADVE